MTAPTDPRKTARTTKALFRPHHIVASLALRDDSTIACYITHSIRGRPRRLLCSAGLHPTHCFWHKHKNKRANQQTDDNPDCHWGFRTKLPDETPNPKWDCCAPNQDLRGLDVIWGRNHAEHRRNFDGGDVGENCQ